MRQSLANVYLHEVPDTWFEEEVKPRMKGKNHLIRYADDAVILFSDENDAKRVLSVLPKRFEKYGLTLHAEKTRLVAFSRPSRYEKPLKKPDGGKSFDFLGFTHYWGKSRKGNWVVQRKTAGKSFQRAVKRMNEWCRSVRHLPVRDQWRQLCLKLMGHNNYLTRTSP